MLNCSTLYTCIHDDLNHCIVQVNLKCETVRKRERTVNSIMTEEEFIDGSERHSRAIAN
jgi:hypothetical protein